MEYNELILDMLNRIVKLEKEVEMLKESGAKSAPLALKDLDNVAEGRTTQRDKTRYFFNGNVYLKNRLVLAVVKDYVLKNETICCDQLKDVFDKSLQGSIGVVEYEWLAKQRKDYQTRFFSAETDIVRLCDGNMLVCSQWGIVNIPYFIKKAESLGYKIEQIIKE